MTERHTMLKLVVSSHFLHLPIATMAPRSEVLLTKGCRFQSLTVVESGALAIWLHFTRSVLQAPEMAEKKEPAKEVEKPKADGVKACL